MERISPVRRTVSQLQWTKSRRAPKRRSTPLQVERQRRAIAFRALDDDDLLAHRVAQADNFNNAVANSMTRPTSCHSGFSLYLQSPF